MSFLASEWASEAAPAADTYERIILMKLASHASDDGRGTYPSVASLARAALCDPETVKRRLRSLLRRKVIAHGDQRLVSHHRADRRPTVYDLLIPVGWYSQQQLDAVNQRCAEVGREPLTTQSRPPLAPAPPKRTRADKGVPNPSRRPAEPAPPATGALTELPVRVLARANGGSERAPARTPDGGSLSRRTGALEEPQTSHLAPRQASSGAAAQTLPACLPDQPPPTPAQSTVRGSHPADGSLSPASSPDTPGARLLRGLRLTRPVTAQVLRQHHQTVTELLDTWPEDALVAHLEREATTGAVANPMGLLIAVIRDTEPYQRPAPPDPGPRWPAWCGADGAGGEPSCNQRTRMREPADGEPVYRCPRCHPLASQPPTSRQAQRPTHPADEAGSMRTTDPLRLAGLAS